MKTSRVPCAAIILAGGENTRMGMPKQWLFFDEKHSFLSRIASQYQLWGCDTVMVVMNQRHLRGTDINLRGLPIKAIGNDKQNLGRMHSIRLGVNACHQPYAFIHNTDQPFFRQETLDALWAQRQSDGYVIPVFEKKGGHPVLIGAKLQEALMESKQDSTLKEFLSHYLCVRKAVADQGVVENINTPEDYRKRFHTDARLVSYGF